MFTVCHRLWGERLPSWRRGRHCWLSGESPIAASIGDRRLYSLAGQCDEPGPQRLPNLDMRLLVPGTEGTDSKREESHTLLLQPRLVVP